MLQLTKSNDWTWLSLAFLLVAALASTGQVRAAGGARLERASDAAGLAHAAIGSLPYEEARVYFVAGDGTVLKEAGVTQRLRHGVYYIPWELAFGDQTPAGTRRIYMVHNHPGGNPALSESDVRLGSFWAARAAEEGIELDLVAITSAGEYASLRESGQFRPVPKGLAAAVDYAGYVLAPGVQMVGSRLMEAARELMR
ncbi:MAG: JAB domain-containing protein [Betaproteobacteria bacterium]